VLLNPPTRMPLDTTLVSAKALFVTEVILLFASNRGLFFKGKFPSATPLKNQHTGKFLQNRQND